MSETATVETPKYEVPAPVVPLIDLVRTTVAEANTLATQVKDAKSGADLRINKALNESEDEAVAKWREWDKKAHEQIEQHKAQIIKHITETMLSDLPQIDAEAVTKEYLNKRQQVTATKKVIAMMVGEDNLKAALGDIEEIVNLHAGGAHSGATLGSKPKPRLASATVNGTSYEKPTFTELAKTIGVDLDVLRKAAFDAAGTDDLFSKVGQNISFTIVNKKSETVNVVVVPRSDAKA